MNTRPRFVVLGILCASIVAACSGGADSSESSSADVSATSTGFSYVGKAVHAALEGELELSRATKKDGVWGESFDNALSGNWLLQTPPASTWGKDRLDVAMECVVVDKLGNTSNQCKAQGLPEANDPSFNHPTCETLGAACASGGTCGALQATVKHDGDAPQKLCLSYADTIVDEIYTQVLSAKTSVDITTLTPPDGRFEAALRNAVTRLADRSAPPRVRLFTGAYPAQAKGKVHDFAFTPEGVLRSLTRDIAVDGHASDASLALKNPKMKIAVAKDTAGASSWNHAKLVVVDGKSAIVGGMNMWAGDYLIRKDPVHDLSIHVAGTAATHAQLFTNQLWDFICVGGGLNATYAALGFDQGGGKGVCHSTSGSTPSGQSGPVQSDFVPTSEKGTGDVPILAVGRLGDISASEQAGDYAFPAMIAAAKSKVRIAQQDIGPFHVGVAEPLPWPIHVLSAIKGALQRGVVVEIVVSNPGGTAGYGNDWKLSDVRARIVGVDGTPLTPAQACNLHLAGLAASEKGSWESGSEAAGRQPYLLHDKLIIIDEQAFYVGSQNIYTANLSEYGMIVDSPTPTAAMGAYYDTMWGYSSKYGTGAAEDRATCGAL